MAKLKLNPSTHPESYFMQFAVLKNKYSQSKRFEEEKIIPLTVAKAPDAYKSVLTA